MRILILAYSFTGNNRLLAQTLVRRLDADLEEVKPLKHRRKASILFDLIFKRKPKVAPLRSDPGGYDHILLMAPIWDRHVGFPLISALAAGLKGRVRSYSFLTLCGSVREGQSDVIRTELQDCLGLAPRRITELHVETLVPEADRKNVSVVSGYRVSEQDLTAFEPAIAEVVAQTRAYASDAQAPA